MKWKGKALQLSNSIHLQSDGNIGSPQIGHSLLKFLALWLRQFSGPGLRQDRHQDTAAQETQDRLKEQRAYLVLGWTPVAILSGFFQ